MCEGSATDQSARGTLQLCQRKVFSPKVAGYPRNDLSEMASSAKKEDSQLLIIEVFKWKVHVKRPGSFSILTSDPAYKLRAVAVHDLQHF